MKKSYLISALVAIFLILLIAYFINSTSKPGPLATNIPCIDDNRPLQEHVHTHLQIITDGNSETIPAEIGLSDSCEKVLHTHDTDGIIHVESNDNLTYTLGMFFDVWGRNINRDEYNLSVTVNGKIYTDAPENIPLRDNEEIILTYSHT